MNFYSVMIYLPVAFLFGIWFYLTVLLKEGTGVYLRKSTKRVSLGMLWLDVPAYIGNAARNLSYIFIISAYQSRGTKRL